MAVLFWSDLHLGHRNILKFRFGKENATEDDIHKHALELLSNYKKIVTKRDIVYFLGDIVFDKKYIPYLKELPGRKILILGNHDSEFFKTSELLEVFEEVLGCKRYKMFWLSHFPMHESELRGKLNIHGHTHNIVIPDKRYINVCVEQTNYFPISLDEIMPIEKRKEYKMNKKENKND